jgi:hypothetical protein
VGTFALSSTVSLIGAGRGTDPAVDTILDANGNGRVLAIATGATATLSGLRITGGNTPGVADSGGGIHSAGRLTIDNCAITDNASGARGGGIYRPETATGPLRISNSTVADNTAQFGGGLFLENAAQAVTITSSVISGNKSTLGNGGGGGIFMIETTVIISETAITGNSAVFRGGGINNNSGSLTFDSASRVTGNSAPNGSGGGIYNGLGTVTLNGAEVSNNTGGNCTGPVAGCVG